ncbi:MAG TPA: AAA family ATPase, partial [Solirubrobacteraceae bacterium]|nr:AAA family ATPase [Solirubrobacteraceae bacterium]
GARIAELVAAGGLVAHDDDVADPALDRVERRLARRARGLADAPPALRLREPERPAEGAFVPSDTQWSVVELVLRHRLVVLTGGPGTGKTSSMRALVDVVRGRSRTVRLCAPTGKAARRLGEATGAQATTIHRLLEWVPGEGFARGADDPIPGTDVLIVDEASMLSVRLADALLAAVGPRTHVLLVGDVDQLAPVGPGRVLEDLIASGVVPTVRLTEVFRQAARSLIVRAAHAIDRGEEPPTVAGEDDVRDFFRVVRDDPGAIFGEVVSLAAERLPAHYGLDPRTDVLVLAPMHKGPVGVDALNDELRRRLNPHGRPVPGTAFRVGDRLIQTRNDHERELMNGELALLAHHDDDRDALLLDCDDGRTLRVPLAESGTLRLAYAISVHKAQGSQAPAVVVPVWRGHHVMLTRNLVYTAVTRAERACVLVGDRHGLRAALARPDAGRRFTRLSERVASSGGRRHG